MGHIDIINYLDIIVIASFRQVFNKQDGVRTGLTRFGGGWVTCVLQLQGLVLAGDSRGRITVLSSSLEAAPISVIWAVKHAPVQSLQVSHH